MLLGNKYFPACCLNAHTLQSKGVFYAEIIFFLVELSKGIKAVGELYLKDDVFCWVLQESGFESTLQP